MVAVSLPSTHRERLDLAKDPATSAAVLQALIGNDQEDYLVRWAVACNPACPPELLVQAGWDEDPQIRTAAANHPHSPVQVLERAIRDPHLNVRTAAANHPNLPDHLKALASLV